MVLIILLHHVRRDGDKTFGIDLTHLLNNEGFSDVFFPIGQSDTTILKGLNQSLTIPTKLITDPLSFLPVKIVVRKVIPFLFIVLDDQPGIDQGIQNRFAAVLDSLLSLVIRDLAGLLLGTEVVFLHLGLRQNVPERDRLAVHNRSHPVVDCILGHSRRNHAKSKKPQHPWEISSHLSHASSWESLSGAV